MEVSLNWLQRYADLPDDPGSLAEALTSLGFEVEGIRSLGGGATGVVVGEVLEVARHPEADKLSLCRVGDGGEVLAVVCGAPNVAAGQKVCFARVGAYLYNTHSGKHETLKAARAKRGLEMLPEWYKLQIFYFSNPGSLHGHLQAVKKPASTARLCRISRPRTPCPSAPMRRLGAFAWVRWHRSRGSASRRWTCWVTRT